MFLSVTVAQLNKFPSDAGHCAHDSPVLVLIRNHPPCFRYSQKTLR
jgi:hypothetical protein